MQAASGLVLRCTPLAEIAPHLFTTASVRLREDAGEWRRVEADLNVPPESLRLIHQVHGRDVAVVRPGDPPSVNRPEADIIISNAAATGIGVRTADCASILFADRRGANVGAAHAGWRGTMQDVAGTAVRALRDTFGVRPSDIIAAVGPCLGPCCGEMGDEVPEAFRAAGHGEGDLERWFDRSRQGKPHFDLWLANADQLERAGVPATSIYVARLCTKCRPEVFHSYRAAGAAVGRMAAAIRPN